MASVSTYLNFNGNTEAAFDFYRTAFGTGIGCEGILRMGDVPPAPGQPPLTEAQRNLIMHITLPILGGHLLMGTDVVESMGHRLVVGNNTSICLHPDTRAEADELFAKLSAGGKVEMPMTEMFWGDYYGSFTDRFGVQWMLNTASKT